MTNHMLPKQSYAQPQPVPNNTDATKHLRPNERRYRKPAMRQKNAPDKYAEAQQHIDDKQF